MPILGINLVQVGVTGYQPQIALVLTDDTEVEVLTAGYLNKAIQNGAPLTEQTIALVATKLTPSSPSTEVGWYDITYDRSTRDWSFGSTTAPGNVVLPTIANHLAVFTDTTGTIGDDPAIAINGGNIQAGLSGTAGYLASFPGTAARGSLRVVAVANTGDTLTTLSNVAMGQASVISIPDPANALGRLLIGATATPFVSGNFPVASGTGGLMVDSGKSAAALPTFTSPTIANHLAVFTNTTGNLGEDVATAIQGGNLQAGLSGTAGTVASFPSAVTSGSLILAAVTNASGNFNTTISNAAAILQSQVVSIPDVGAATGNFLVSNSLTGQAAAMTLATAAPNNFSLNSTAVNATTITSGFLAAAGGNLSIVSASGGSALAVYGQAGVTGTLSGSAGISAMTGALLLSNATVNAAVVSPLIGIWAATATTQTSMVNTSLLRLVNSSTDVLFSQLYLEGDATNLANIAATGVPAFYIAAGTSAGSAGDAAHCAAQQVLRLVIKGATVYIPVFTQNT